MAKKAGAAAGASWLTCDTFALQMYQDWTDPGPNGLYHDGICRVDATSSSPDSAGKYYYYGPQLADPKLVSDILGAIAKKNGKVGWQFQADANGLITAAK